MNSRLTDAELIQLVEQKLPEELSADEIAQLRERLRASRELQRVLIEQMHLEEYLTAALGEFRVSIDDIVRRAADQKPKSKSPLWILGLSTAVVLIALGLFFGLRGKKPDEEGDAVAKNDPVQHSPTDLPEGQRGKPANGTGKSGDKSAETAVGDVENVMPTVSESWVAVLQAEEFDRGNLQIDTMNFGDGIGVVHSGDQPVGFVEYDLEIPRDGLYQVEMRYASEEARPLMLNIGGIDIRNDAARNVTGDPWPEGQKAWTEARIPLKAGRTTIRLSTDGYFPHLDKLALAELPANQSAVSDDTTGIPLVALKPVPATVADANAPKHPWDAALDPTKPPAPFVRSAFSSFPLTANNYEFTAADWKEWLEPIAGQPLRIVEEPVANRRFALWEGIGRLRSPWPRDAVLRLGLFDYEQLKIHLWNGTEGVSLQWFGRQDTMTWGAFHAHRKANEPRPSELSLTTTDGGRHLRTDLGVFELRHQAGTLVMTRGDVRLLTIPMSRPPKDVILEGRTRVSGIALQRSEPAPPITPSHRKALVKSSDPADLKWLTDLVSPADMEQPSGGAVELRSPPQPKGTEPRLIWCGTPLASRGLYEVIVKVSGAEPGSGIYLGDERGNPIHHIGFFQEKRSNRTTFGYGWSTYGYEKPPVRLDADHDPALGPIPWSDREQWLRIVLGSGSLRIWTSGDGVNWGRLPRDPVRGVRRNFGSVGIYAVTGEKPRTIRLDHVEVRELSGLTSLAEENVRAQVQPPDSLETIDGPNWLDWVIRTRPKDVDLAQWRRACAIVCLMQNVRPDLASTLLKGLTNELVTLPISALARLQALEDIALVGDLWGGAWALAFLDQFTSLAEALAREGNPDPYSLIATALVESPLTTEMRFNSAPLALVRQAALRQVASGRWAELRSLATRWRHWLRSANPDHRWAGNDLYKTWWLDWSDAIAAHRQSAKAIGEPSGMVAGWKHPLVIQLSKEGYNVLSEFESALASKSYEDACQLIGAAGSGGILGLLPDAKDPQLLVSMPRAIALAMRDHPDLLTAMRGRNGKLGLLRVRQAMETGDEELLSAATVQYFGTEAAAEAHRWLGDRAVASGKFSRGLDHYREALSSATTSATAELTARMRLASAMQGQAFGDAVTTPVQVGSTSLRPDTFEALVNELRTARSSTAGPAASAEPSVQEAGLAPPLARLEARSHGRLGLDPGNAPGAGQVDVDWAGRQIVAVPVGNILYIYNRFALQAWDVDQKKPLWTANLVANEQGSTHAWPNLPMRPVIAGDRIYARCISKKGCELACVDRTNGKVLWRKQANQQIVSDPVWTRERVLALVSQPVEPGVFLFQVVAFHLETGEVLSEEPIFRARDVWGGQPAGTMVEGRGRFIVSLGGSLVCCDRQGRPQWLRRSTWAPPVIDQTFHQQFLAPPFIDGDRVLHVQPGSHEVVCVELSNGRLLWSRSLADARRVVGIAGETIVTQSEAGFTGFARDNGHFLWFAPISNPLEGVLTSPQAVVVTRRVDLTTEQKASALVWLDPADGREVGSWVFRNLTDPNLRFSPLVAAGGRWWGFFGKANEVHRDLIELTKLDGPAPLPLASSTWPQWIETTLPKFATDAALVLPGWTPAAVHQVAPNGLVPDVRGEKDVFVTHVERNRPAVWLRTVSLAEGKPARLQVKVGVPAAQSWTLVIAANGEELLKQSIDEKSAASGWFEATVDLARLSGRTIDLTAMALPSPGPKPTDPPKPADPAWKRLDLLP